MMHKLFYFTVLLFVASSCSGNAIKGAKQGFKNQQDSIAQIKSKMKTYIEADSIAQKSSPTTHDELWINRELRNYILQRQDSFPIKTPLNIQFLDKGSYVSYRYEDFQEQNRIAFQKNQQRFENKTMRLERNNDSTIVAKIKGKTYTFIKYPSEWDNNEFPNLSRALQSEVFDLASYNALVKSGTQDSIFTYSISPDWTDETYVGSNQEVFKYRLSHSYPTMTMDEKMSRIKYYIIISRKGQEPESYEIKKNGQHIEILDLGNNQLVYEWYKK